MPASFRAITLCREGRVSGRALGEGVSLETLGQTLRRPIKPSRLSIPNLDIFARLRYSIGTAYPEHEHEHGFRHLTKARVHGELTTAAPCRGFSTCSSDDKQTGEAPPDDEEPQTSRTALTT